MDDILEIMDDAELGGTLVTSDVDLGADLDAVLACESPLSESEARELTDAIRSCATATYVLLHQAHSSKAHVALGYETWADYVKEEFNFSAQRSYQLLDLAKVVQVIEQAAPEGTEVRLTEAQARDIKRELPRITEKVEEQTSGLDPRDASEVVEAIVQETRESARFEEAAKRKRQEELDQAKEDGYHAGLEAAADAMLENAPQTEAPGWEDAPDEKDLQEDEFASRLTAKQMDTLSVFASCLASVAKLPDPQDVLDIIPDTRFDDVYDQVMSCSAWMKQMVALMQGSR